MKVSELIELLKAMPQDLEVVVVHDYCYHWRVNVSSVETLDVRRDGSLFETEDSEFDAKVVSIT
ncbi:hypothetical protein C4J91_3547 [Pseudomonas sp. R3-52-08]|nr:hypothetical protein C4J91_3547 [Pseudomonas sp. R3-52-08]